MKRIVTIAVLTIALAAAANAYTKRALVIGLGEQEDTSWGKINGDKDVLIVKEMLKTAGFSHITTLVNKQATKAGIVSAFKRLASRCDKGDMVYVHFSGHGQQMTDINGDERGIQKVGERDGLDEAWIPYDAYRKYGDKDHGEKHLSDDEIGELLTSVKEKVGSEGKILVVVDACHSGDGTRQATTADEVPTRGVWDNFVIPVEQSSGTAERIEEKWITISACKSYQTNEELKGKAVGKLTYALVDIIGSGEKLTNSEVGARLRTFFLKNPSKKPQTPILTGATEDYNVTDIF